MQVMRNQEQLNGVGSETHCQPPPDVTLLEKPWICMLLKRLESLLDQVTLVNLLLRSTSTLSNDDFVQVY